MCQAVTLQVLLHTCTVILYSVLDRASSEKGMSCCTYNPQKCQIHPSLLLTTNIYFNVMIIIIIIIILLSLMVITVWFTAIQLWSHQLCCILHQQLPPPLIHCVNTSLTFTSLKMSIIEPGPSFDSVPHCHCCLKILWAISFAGAPPFVLTCMSCCFKLYIAFQQEHWKVLHARSACWARAPACSVHSQNNLKSFTVYIVASLGWKLSSTWKQSKL